MGVEECIHCDAGRGSLWAKTDLFAELTCHLYFGFDVDALTVRVSGHEIEGGTRWEGGSALLLESLLQVLFSLLTMSEKENFLH